MNGMSRTSIASALMGATIARVIKGFSWTVGGVLALRFMGVAI